MRTDFTEAMLAEIQKTSVRSLAYHLYFNDTDIISYLAEYPKITRELGRLSVGDVTYKLTPAASYMLIDVGVASLYYTGDGVDVRFTVAVAGDECNLARGKLSEITFGDDVIEIRAADRTFDGLESKWGESDGAASGTCLVASVWWHAMTAIAGMSDVANTSNPDIDYTAYYGWWMEELTNKEAHYYCTGESVRAVHDAIAELCGLSAYVDFQNRISLVPYHVLTVNTTDHVPYSYHTGSYWEISESDMVGDYDLRTLDEYYDRVRQRYGASDGNLAEFYPGNGDPKWAEVVIGKKDRTYERLTVRMSSYTNAYNMCHNAFHRYQKGMLEVKFALPMRAFQMEPGDNLQITFERDKVLSVITGSSTIWFTARDLEYKIGDGLVEVTAIEMPKI